MFNEPVYIPCPKCLKNVATYSEGNYRNGFRIGGPYVTHFITRDVCYLDPISERFVVWVLNNPEWD